MSQNYFINPNLKDKLLKIITFILEGSYIKQNEQKLNDFRKINEYPLILCQLLAQANERSSLMSLTPMQANKKNFLALEIKKNATRLTNQQCWWLMRPIYFSDSDKIAKLIRQACLLYEHQQQTKIQLNHFYIFFCVDLEDVGGFVGLVRYLVMVYSLMSQQSQMIRNEAIREFGNQIVDKLFETIKWQLSEYFYEFILTCLIMLKSALGEHQCWNKGEQWNYILQYLIFNKNKPLIKCLAKHLQNQINQSNPQYRQNYNSVSSNNIQILQSVKNCLKNVKGVDIPIQKLFYIDCLDILGLYWTRNIRSSQNNAQINDNSIFAGEIIKIYSEYLKTQHIFEKDLNTYIDQLDEIEKLGQTKKFSFLKIIFGLLSRQQLKRIIQQFTSFQIQIMQFSLCLPTQCNNQFISSMQLQSCLNNLYSALQQQTDAYLFIRDKQEFIWTLLKYVMKYKIKFDRQLALKICYTIDFLAYKCDTVSKQCFEILDAFSEQILYVQGCKLIDFVELSLCHINQNQWLQTNNSYFHIINILVNLTPEFIFNNKSQIIFGQYFSSIQKQILKMITKMISILRQQFNYQTMHKLNTLLQYLLQCSGKKICQILKYNEMYWVVNANFSYEIYTQSFVDIYCYFCQLFQNQQIFVQSLNLYDFWQKCESERLKFFVTAYLKLIGSEYRVFTSSQGEHKLIQLKKNLWHRFVNENNEDERQKIVQVFKVNRTYLSSLYQEYQRQLSMNGGNGMGIRYNNNVVYTKQRMQIQ